MIRIISQYVIDVNYIFINKAWYHVYDTRDWSIDDVCDHMHTFIIKRSQELTSIDASLIYTRMCLNLSQVHIDKLCANENMLQYAFKRVICNGKILEYAIKKYGIDAFVDIMRNRCLGCITNCSHNNDKLMIIMKYAKHVVYDYGYTRVFIYQRYSRMKYLVEEHNIDINICNCNIIFGIMGQLVSCVYLEPLLSTECIMKLRYMYSKGFRVDAHKQYAIRTAAKYLRPEVIKIILSQPACDPTILNYKAFRNACVRKDAVEIVSLLATKKCVNILQAFAWVLHYAAVLKCEAFNKVIIYCLTNIRDFQTIISQRRPC